MLIPFTPEQFFQVFENYNQAVSPMQIFLVFAAFAAVVAADSPKRFSGEIISICLAFLWLWTGFVYHFIFFTEINSAAYLFAVLFITQGILFLYLGVLKKRLSFQVERNFHTIIGMVFIVYALIIYPVVGRELGRVYPESPTFGAPCPTVIFTFGLLLWTNKKLPFYILVIPFLWSLIGIWAAIDFGVIEDFGLLIAGTVGTALLIRRKF